MAGATFSLQVEWEFESGKFAPREAILETIMDEVQDPGSIDAEEGTYQIVTWEIQEEDPFVPLSRKKLIEKMAPACLVLGITDKHKIEQFILLYEAKGGRFL